MAPRLHRTEAAVLGRLPPGLPAPRLLGAVHDGTVVALAVEHVAGRQLGSPWTPTDLTAAQGALDGLAAAATPCPVPDLPAAEQHLAHDLAGWARLAADPHPGLDPWAARHLPELVAVTSGAAARLAGDTLAHGDVRGDNLILGDDRHRGVVVVDWPHACRGADWFDALSLALDAWVDGCLDPERALARSRVLARADPADVTAVLAGMTGCFLDAARRPVLPALPTLRDFQAWQGDAALVWLRRRLPAWR